MKNREKYTELLKQDYPYRFELHAHTSPASGCAEIAPEEVVRRYSELGYSGIAITNHFCPDDAEDKNEFLRVFFDDFYRARETGEKLGVKVIFGAELNFFNENNNDYLLFGINEENLREIYDYMSTTIDEFVAKCKNDKMFLCHAHPYRQKEIILRPELIDGFEGINIHPHHNSKVALAARYAKENNLILTCGTDYHHNTHEGLSAMRFNKLPSDTYEIAEILKEDDFIMEIGGRVLLP